MFLQLFGTNHLTLLNPSLALIFTASEIAGIPLLVKVTKRAILHTFASVYCAVKTEVANVTF